MTIQGLRQLARRGRAEGRAGGRAGAEAAVDRSLMSLATVGGGGADVLAVAGPVFAFVARFRERLAGGEQPPIDEVNSELTRLLRICAQRSSHHPRLVEMWPRIRNPLVYLLDETLIRISGWQHGEMWEEHHALELSTLVGHSSRMRAVLFFEELEESLRLSTTLTDPVERQLELDLLSVFYLCIRNGFRGQYQADDAALEKVITRLVERLRWKTRVDRNRMTPYAYWTPAGASAGRSPVIVLSVLALVLMGAVLAAGWTIRQAWTAVLNLPVAPASATLGGAA